MPSYLNPKRKIRSRSWKSLSFIDKFKLILSFPIAKLGFKHPDFYYVHGHPQRKSIFVNPDRRLKVGMNVSLMDATINVSSGFVTIEDDVTFGHHVMILTGIHKFTNGRLSRFTDLPEFPEVPTTGRDIYIGHGTYVGSGAIILGGVTIGNDCIIGAGSVVTKSVPERSTVLGVAASFK
jgi:acetyltransferase-like isoleucine patch superfamily enzyme